MTLHGPSLLRGKIPMAIPFFVVNHPPYHPHATVSEHRGKRGCAEVKEVILREPLSSLFLYGEKNPRSAEQLRNAS